MDDGVGHIEYHEKPLSRKQLFELIKIVDQGKSEASKYALMLLEHELNPHLPKL